MKKSTIALSILAITGAIVPLTSNATVSFTGVSAGDTTNNAVTLWTRALDGTSPATLSVRIATDSANLDKSTASQTNLVTNASKDYTLKVQLTGLQSGTVYYYQFTGPANEKSLIGRFTTAPDPTAQAAVRFAFSGDMDGLMRPYALASTIPAQNFDFYVNLGDVIYENASNAGVTTGVAGPNNSPSVTLSGTVPAPTSTGATQAQLFADYSKKYREQFLPINVGGQNGLQTMYAAQGIYALYDNHELGNRQYVNGGAPAGGVIGDMPTGAGVDARDSTNDVGSGIFMDQSFGFPNPAASIHELPTHC